MIKNSLNLDIERNRQRSTYLKRRIKEFAEAINFNYVGAIETIKGTLYIVSLEDNSVRESILNMQEEEEYTFLQKYECPTITLLNEEDELWLSSAANTTKYKYKKDTVKLRYSGAQFTSEGQIVMLFEMVKEITKLCDVILRKTGLFLIKDNRPQIVKIENGEIIDV